MESEKGIMTGGQDDRPVHHANDLDQADAREVVIDVKSRGNSRQHAVGFKSHKKDNAGSKNLYKNSKDFERFTAAVSPLLEYLGTNLKTFRSEVAKREDITGRAVVRMELINRLTEKEGDKCKALLTVVAGKSKNDPEEYLLKPQSLVLAFVDALLLKNAHLDYRDQNNQNPVHHAVKRDFKDVVSRLLKNEDNVTVSLEEDNNYESALDIALKEKKDEMAALMVKRLPSDEYVGCR